MGKGKKRAKSQKKKKLEQPMDDGDSSGDESFLNYTLTTANKKSRLDQEEERSEDHEETKTQGKSEADCYMELSQSTEVLSDGGRENSPKKKAKEVDIDVVPKKVLSCLEMEDMRWAQGYCGSKVLYPCFLIQPGLPWDVSDMDTINGLKDQQDEDGTGDTEIVGFYHTTGLGFALVKREGMVPFDPRTDPHNVCMAQLKLKPKERRRKFGSGKCNQSVWNCLKDGIKIANAIYEKLKAKELEEKQREEAELEEQKKEIENEIAEKRAQEERMPKKKDQPIRNITLDDEHFNKLEAGDGLLIFEKGKEIICRITEIDASKGKSFPVKIDSNFQMGHLRWTQKVSKIIPYEKAVEYVSNLGPYVPGTRYVTSQKQIQNFKLCNGKSEEAIWNSQQCQLTRAYKETLDAGNTMRSQAK